jgi:hypothetical protein
MDEDVWEHVSGLDRADQAAFAAGAMKESSYLSPSLATRVFAALSPDKQGEYARQIGQALSRTGLSDAAAFLSKLPEAGHAATKRQALLSVVHDWAYLEPGAAMGFVATLAVGETKDAATQTLAAQLRNFDLQAATQLVSTITTPTVREALIKQLANDWARVNPQRGRELIKPLLRSDEDRKQAAALWAH